MVAGVPLAAESRWMPCREAAREGREWRGARIRTEAARMIGTCFLHPWRAERQCFRTLQDSWDLPLGALGLSVTIKAEVGESPLSLLWPRI